MITTRSIRTFLIGLFLTFSMVFISRSGAGHVLLNPMPKPIDVLGSLRPRLEARQNHFQIKKQLVTPVYAGGEYEQASAYVIADFDSGQILLSKNLSKRLPVASLTKLATAVVSLDLVGLGEQFIVSNNATRQIPTKVMLKPGERYSLSKLLDFMLISSANDSAEVIAEGIDAKFGQNTFIKAMNAKSQILGLQNTHFTNAKGYDDNNNFSSAEDLTVLSAYAIKAYPEIAGIVSREFKDLTGGIDFRFYLNNWNGLLGVYPGVSGVKIGNTGQAGQCTIVLSERGGRKLLAVILGAPGVLERDLWAAGLLDLGFKKLAGLLPVNITKDQLKAKYATWKYFE